MQRVEQFLSSYGPEATDNAAVAAFLAWSGRHASLIRAELSVSALEMKLQQHKLDYEANGSGTSLACW